MAFARPGGLGGRRVRLRLRKQPATADRQMDEMGMGWDGMGWDGMMTVRDA